MHLGGKKFHFLQEMQIRTTQVTCAPEDNGGGPRSLQHHPEPQQTSAMASGSPMGLDRDATHSLGLHWRVWVCVGFWREVPRLALGFQRAHDGQCLHASLRAGGGEPRGSHGRPRQLRNIMDTRKHKTSISNSTHGAYPRDPIHTDSAIFSHPAHFPSNTTVLSRTDWSALLQPF